MASSNWRVLRWVPRRIQRSVRVANQRSTKLIQEALVGVKWRWKRGWRASQRWMSGVGAHEPWTVLLTKDEQSEAGCREL